MGYQQKKADSVGVGLLKEGDNANSIYISLIANPNKPASVNGLLRVPII